MRRLRLWNTGFDPDDNSPFYIAHFHTWWWGLRHALRYWGIKTSKAELKAMMKKSPTQDHAYERYFPQWDLTLYARITKPGEYIVTLVFQDKDGKHVPVPWVMP